MKKISLFVGVLLYAIGLPAQYQVKKSSTYKNVQYDAFIIKADSSLKRSFKIVQNSAGGSEADFFAAQAAQGDFFAITAGIVDSACKPLGLYIADSKEINTINLGSGGDNFYLKPNGILGFDGAKFSITEATAFSNNNLLYAIQPGPLLVNNGQSNTNFTKGSKNRHIRCGVGLYSKGGADYLVFVKSNIPVNFFDFASLFIQKYACKMALNLTSAANCSLHLPGTKDAGRSGVRVCNYLCIKL